MSKIKVEFLLILIFLLGLFLRVMHLKGESLTFTYDQARDAFIMQNMVKGDIKFQGPPATAPGLFHGVLYYYLMLPAYVIGQGNPISAAIWLSIINSLTIFVVYGFSIAMFKDKKLSLILCLLFSVSFGESQYSTWLSNGSISSLFVPLFYFGLWGWMNKKDWGPAFAAIGLAGAVQSVIFMLYQIPVLLILWLLKKVSFDKKNLLKFMTIFILGISTVIISDIKFGFPSLRGINNLLIKQDAAVVNKTFMDHLGVYLNQFGHLFSINLFPLNEGYAGFLGIFLIIFALRFAKSSELIILYVLSSLIASPFGGSSTPYITVGLSTGVILLLGLFFSFLVSKNKFWLVLLISTLMVIVNVFFIVTKGAKGQTNFAIQDLTLKDEKAALDYIYLNQKGRPFSLNTITSPLYINVLWSYLFNWYGKKTYLYLPYWHGHAQIDLLGNNLQKPTKETTDYYLIIEPSETNLDPWIPQLLEEESGHSRLIEEKKFGQIRVQKREKI
jgi:hypothetical protein